MRLSLDQVDRELGKLWEAESRKGGAARVGLLTLVALANEPELLGRAQRVVSDVVRVQPSRTIVASWRPGDSPSITADVALHRPSEGGAACGDSITLEAIGDAREWIPGNAERLSLPDLPQCVWWVGDLPDFDDLFERMVVGADVVIVNSQEMDLRDLEKLSTIALRAQRSYALADLTWIRLRWLQDLIARFFDDEAGREWLPRIERVHIDYSPREGDRDAMSTRAGLLFGWIANALGLRGDGALWKRGDGWAEVKVGKLEARFEQCRRAEVRPGGIVRVAMECPGAKFEIVRLEDPQTFRWTRDLPGVPTPPHVMHVQSLDESTLLIRCLERPRRDELLETSLHVGSRIARVVAPRLSVQPTGP